MDIRFNHFFFIDQERFCLYLHKKALQGKHIIKITPLFLFFEASLPQNYYFYFEKYSTENNTLPSTIKPQAQLIDYLNGYGLFKVTVNQPYSKITTLDLLSYKKNFAFKLVVYLIFLFEFTIRITYIVLLLYKMNFSLSTLSFKLLVIPYGFYLFSLLFYGLYLFSHFSMLNKLDYPNPISKCNLVVNLFLSYGKLFLILFAVGTFFSSIIIFHSD